MLYTGVRPLSSPGGFCHFEVRGVVFCALIFCTTKQGIWNAFRENPSSHEIASFFSDPTHQAAQPMIPQNIHELVGGGMDRGREREKKIKREKESHKTEGHLERL